MFFSTNGNVGFHTNAPEEAVSIEGNVGITGGDLVFKTAGKALYAFNGTDTSQVFAVSASGVAIGNDVDGLLLLSGGTARFFEARLHPNRVPTKLNI